MCTTQFEIGSDVEADRERIGADAAPGDETCNQGVVEMIEIRHVAAAIEEEFAGHRGARPDDPQGSGVTLARKSRGDIGGKAMSVHVLVAAGMPQEALPFG